MRLVELPPRDRAQYLDAAQSKRPARVMRKPDGPGPSTEQTPPPGVEPERDAERSVGPVPVPSASGILAVGARIAGQRPPVATDSVGSVAMHGTASGGASLPSNASGSYPPPLVESGERGRAKEGPVPMPAKACECTPWCMPERLSHARWCRCERVVHRKPSVKEWGRR